MNIAILGAGNIARYMGKTLVGMTDVNAYAVASRDINKAKAFANEFGFAKAYGSYLELVEDDNVDLVYIATPHSFHYEQAMLCLHHKKHILVEKSFTASAWQAEEIIALGRKEGLLVAEAIWTRYMPSRQLIQSLIEDKTIGNIQSLTANLGYLINDKARIKDPHLAGGALLDVGVYPLNFASMVLGDEIDEVTSSAVLMDSGVDAQNSITITYNNGAMALLHSSTLTQTDRKGIIYGDQGYIEVENINNCEGIKIYDLNRACIRDVTIPEQITGFEYQVTACKEAIENHDVEIKAMPHKEIIRIMKLMDTLRKSWGVVYPSDDPR